MRKKLLTVVLRLAASLVRSACEGNGMDDTSAGKTGAVVEGASQVAGSNTAMIAMDSGFPTLDPGHVYERYPPLIVNACCENLFKFCSNDGAPEPCLADTYEFSEDGLTLTVRLKQSATFTNSNPTTSADVLSDIDRCRNLQGNPSFICDTAESIEAPDDYTVVFHLTQADSAILPKLTYSSTAILGNAVMKEHGGTDTEDASSTGIAQSYLGTASTGPSICMIISYISDQKVVLEKNPNCQGEAINVDKSITEIQPGANTQIVTLSGGDTGVAMNMIGDIMSELEGAESISIISGATKVTGFVMMNMDGAYSGPVPSPQVQNTIRRALDYIDIQTICGSDTITPHDIIQVGFMGSKGEGPADYMNLGEAKALLVGTGYPDRSDVGLTVIDPDMGGVLLTGLVQKIKDDLSQVGVNVNTVSQPWAAGYGDVYCDETLGFTVMYWGTDYNDPGVQLEFLPGGVVRKRAGWSTDMDPELVAIYEKTMSVTDSDARVAVLGEIQNAIYEHEPFIMAVQAPSRISYSTRLREVAISDPCTLDLTLIHVK